MTLHRRWYDVVWKLRARWVNFAWNRNFNIGKRYFKIVLIFFSRKLGLGIDSQEMLSRILFGLNIFNCHNNNTGKLIWLQASGHVTFRQRRINVDATSWRRCTNVMCPLESSYNINYDPSRIFSENKEKKIYLKLAVIFVVSIPRVRINTNRKKYLYYEQVFVSRCDA